MTDLNTGENKEKKPETGTRSQSKSGSEFRKLRKRRKIIIRAVFAVFTVLFLISASMAVSTWRRAKREQNAFDELARLIETKEVPRDASRLIEIDSEEGGAEAVTAEEKEPETASSSESSLNLDFSALAELNGDFFGWISIAGTVINYPVMYTPEDTEYYLHRGFDKQYSVSGVPFLGDGCGPGSDNTLIFGHNMKNGTMFASLKRYEDKDYYNAHRVINFGTLGENGIYEVMAAFRERVHFTDEEDAFRYYAYGGVLTREEFEDYISAIRALSFYDTGIDAEYGDKLITLSTCDYYTGEGRFVVVAKKI